MNINMAVATKTFGNDLSNIISIYEGAHQLSDDSWKKLVTFAVESKSDTKAAWWEACYPGEVVVLEYREEQGEDGLKTKAGKWKISKVCSNSTYSSNKAVIGKALDSGVSLLDDDGNIRGKTELERAIKESTSKKKSAYEIANIGLNMCINQLGNLTQEELDTIKMTFTTAMDNYNPPF